MSLRMHWQSYSATALEQLSVCGLPYACRDASGLRKDGRNEMRRATAKNEKGK
jgi:hypothetical protein